VSPVFPVNPFRHALTLLELTQNDIAERLLSPKRFLVRVLTDGLIGQDHYMAISPAKNHQPYIATALPHIAA
jgi:hypothetical protein